MKVTKSAVFWALVLAVCLPAITMAQNEQPADYTYATYFECDVAQQAIADMIVESVQTPIYDKAVTDGVITNWGWLSHHTGGKWRRILYYSAPSFAALFKAQEALGTAAQESNADALYQFGVICNAHDDYIWQRAAGNASSRGKLLSATYFVCDQSKEARADEIVNTVFTPALDALVQQQKLTSWGWTKHVIGGEFRRLMTMTAADAASVVSTREAFADQIRAKNAKELNEFFSICPSHHDYLWEIKHEK